MELETNCDCFEPREKFKQHHIFTSKLFDIIEQVQFEKKPLYIEIEETGINQKARIKIKSLFHIVASASFNSKEMGNKDHFIMKLLDWDKQLVFRRKEKKLKLGIFRRYQQIEWRLQAWSG